MRVALPLFGNRVAPRCLHAESMLLASIDKGKVNSQLLHNTSGLSSSEKVELLVNLGIDVIICGAAPEDFREEAQARGIAVITNIAGEAEDILTQLVKGELVSGYRLSSNSKEPGIQEKNSLDSIDCIRCVDRVCLQGGKCATNIETISIPHANDKLKKTFEVSSDVALENDPKLCRIAELVHFCVGMEYKHLGLAFCIEMFKEAEILVGVLRRFFTVSPVCCKVGGFTAEEVKLPEGPQDLVCNVVGQAKLLNQRRTDLNIIAGLCLGCDIIFSRFSDAPVTTLFVKDKMLANNPVGALFSKYYLEDLALEI